MNDINDDIAAAEAEWVPTVIINEELPETELVAKVQRVFEAQILPLAAVRKRRAELGVENAALCTREHRQALTTINGMWRKINGQVDHVGEFLKAEALLVQKTVNGLMKMVKGEVAREQRPILDKFAEWKAEDEAAERAKVEAELQAKREAEEAERKAAQAIEDARRAAEAEANLKEAERLSIERWRLAEEQRKLNEANRAENARIEAERRKIDEAQRIEREKLAEERREFEAAQRAAAKIESDRQAKIAADKAAEEAEQRRIALEAADKFNREQAAEKERLRLEAIEPDLPKLRRFAAAIKLTADKAPKLTSAEATELSTWAVEHLTRIAAAVLDFGTTQTKGQ